jgi:hypothetical protein
MHNKAIGYIADRYRGINVTCNQEPPEQQAASFSSVDRGLYSY